MSFLPGSSWHQSALISGSGGFGPPPPPPSSGCQQQQQPPANGLPAASSPTVLASAQTAATDPHARHHRQGQTPLRGVSDPADEGGPKITFLKDEAPPAGGSASSMRPFLKIEDKALRGGTQSEDGHRAGGPSLGSAGQSPSSPLSTYSSSTPSPSAPVPERSSLNPLTDQKHPSDLVLNANPDTEVGAQVSPMTTRGVDGTTTFTGTNRSSSRRGEEEMKGSPFGSRGGPGADPPTRGSGTFSQTGEGRTGACGGDVSPSRDTTAAEGETGGLHAASLSSPLPQRTAVRRAMSECSHLAVPPSVAGAYPSPATSGLPRPPYPHVAVRRSLTVTDGTAAAAAMATVTPSSLMTSPVLPSSPPPRRHHGSCDTSFLLPVPPPAGAPSPRERPEKGKLCSVSLWVRSKGRNIRQDRPQSRTTQSSSQTGAMSGSHGAMEPPQPKPGARRASPPLPLPVPVSSPPAVLVVCAGVCGDSVLVCVGTLVCTKGR